MEQRDCGPSSLSTPGCSRATVPLTGHCTVASFVAPWATVANGGHPVARKEDQHLPASFFIFLPQQPLGDKTCNWEMVTDERKTHHQLLADHLLEAVAVVPSSGSHFGVASTGQRRIRWIQWTARVNSRRWLSHERPVNRRRSLLASGTTRGSFSSLLQSPLPRTKKKDKNPSSPTRNGDHVHGHSNVAVLISMRLRSNWFVVLYRSTDDRYFFFSFFSEGRREILGKSFLFLGAFFTGSLSNIALSLLMPWCMAWQLDQSRPLHHCHIKGLYRIGCSTKRKASLSLQSRKVLGGKKFLFIFFLAKKAL